MSRPKTCAEIPEKDRLKAILENWEQCHKHSWKAPQKEPYFNLNKTETIMVSRCRYCGQNRRAYEYMKKILAEEALASKQPMPEGMIL